MRNFLLVALIVPALQAQVAPQQWSLVEVKRIGSVDGPDALTRVHGLLLSPDGQRVYVSQRDEHVIRVFDAASGRSIGKIGREGAGPGEFRGLAWIGWKQDTLYAVDNVLRSVSFFSRTGQHLRTDRIAAPADSPTQRPPLPVAYLSDGTIIGSPSVSTSEIIAGRVKSSPWVQMTREGKLIRVIAEEDVRNRFAQAAIGNRIAVFRAPMTEGTLVRIVPDGSSLLIINQPIREDEPGRFYVTRVRATGDTVYHREYRYNPRPVTSKVAHRIYGQIAESFASSSNAAKLKQAIEAQVTLPSTQPPISGAVASSNGTLWLRGEDLGTPSVRWLVLDPAGSISATTQAPTELDILAVDRDVVWGTIRDELDVPYVVRYRVRQGNGQ